VQFARLEADEERVLPLLRAERREDRRGRGEELASSPSRPAAMSISSMRCDE
jgi:hypothetical protein